MAYISLSILGAGAWGIVASALLLPAFAWVGVPRLLASVLCMLLVGFPPITLYYLRSGELKQFAWYTWPIGWWFAGMACLFIGTILQVVLLACGVHSILGLRIDTWLWSFPFRGE